MKKVKETKVEKIKAEELESLQAIVQLINQTQLSIGGLEVQKMELLGKLDKAKEELNAFQVNLEKSYGNVSVSLVDGTIAENADNKED